MSDKRPKKILILGATGPTGLLTVQRALDHGHTVTAYARNPSKIPSEASNSPNLEILTGELTDTTALSHAISNQDAIISLLGPTDKTITDTPITNAYHSIFPAMKQHNVTQILAMGTASIADPQDGFSILARLGVSLIRLIASAAYKDIVGVGRVFDTEAAEYGLDWTIFRLGFLGDGAARGAKAGYVGRDGWSIKVQRADVANWLVGEFEKEDSEWVGKRPALWSA